MLERTMTFGWQCRNHPIEKGFEVLSQFKVAIAGSALEISQGNLTPLLASRRSRQPGRRTHEDHRRSKQSNARCQPTQKEMLEASNGTRVHGHRDAEESRWVKSQRCR